MGLPYRTPGPRNPNWRNGRYTIAETARKMLEAGHGLSEREIERFYARTEAARSGRRRNTAAEEFRNLLEQRYGPKGEP